MATVLASVYWSCRTALHVCIPSVPPNLNLPHSLLASLSLVLSIETVSHCCFAKSPIDTEAQHVSHWPTELVLD